MEWIIPAATGSTEPEMHMKSIWRHTRIKQAVKSLEGLIGTSTDDQRSKLAWRTMKGSGDGFDSRRGHEARDQRS